VAGFVGNDYDEADGVAAVVMRDDDKGSASAGWSTWTQRMGARDFGRFQVEVSEMFKPPMR
jgi:hypothetical protein